MKQLVTILLLLVVFTQTFNRFAIEADYFINKSYVAKNLCVNRDKPAMNCCGKCFLKKQLKKQEKQDQSPTTKKTSSEVQLFFAANESSTGCKGYVFKSKYLLSNNSLLSFFPRSVFRPPVV